MRKSDGVIIAEMKMIHCMQQQYISSVSECPDNMFLAFSFAVSAARFVASAIFATSSTTMGTVFFAISRKVSAVLNKIKMCLS